MKRDGIAEVVDQKKAQALPKGCQRVAEAKLDLRRIDTGHNVKEAGFFMKGYSYPFIKGRAFVHWFHPSFEPWIEWLRIDYGDASRPQADATPSHLNRPQVRRTPQDLLSVSKTSSAKLSLASG